MKYLTTALSLAAAVIAQSPTAMAQDASAKAREMFIKADTNQDGALSLEEWKAAGRRDRGFAMIDADKDGKVTATEAEAGVSALLATHDADKSGALSEAEFAALFSEVTKGMAARPFAMLDDDGNKEISAEEITFPVKMMARMGRLTDINAETPTKP